MRLRNITLHQLRIFHSLGRNLSFTRAAEELHLSQPAVSIQIKRLEDSIGLPLVELVGKRIYLTNAGRELFEACGEIDDRLRALGDELTGLHHEVKGPLHLSAITASEYFMPHLLGAFLRAHPEVDPRLVVTNQTRIIERLEHNVDDLVIMGTVPDTGDLHAELFLDNPLVPVAHPAHPLVGQKAIPLARLVEEPFLIREPESGTRRTTERLFLQHGLGIDPHMELGSSEAVKQGVMAGLGVAVMSQHNLRMELDAGMIAILDVQGFPLARRWYAVHRRGKRLSVTARSFLDFLLQDGARIWEQTRPSRARGTQSRAGKKPHRAKKAD